MVFEYFVQGYPGLDNVGSVELGRPADPQGSYDTPVEEQDEAYLQEYLLAWLERGNGVEFTGRSYETYLRVALDIADATMRGAIQFDYKGSEKQDYKDAYPRRVIGIHQPGLSAQDFSDRALYDQAVTRWEFRGSGKLSPHADIG